MLNYKDRLIKLCEQELDYYDIVNESNETVEFGLIIEFLTEKYIEILRDGLKDGNREGVLMIPLKKGDTHG